VVLDGGHHVHATYPYCCLVRGRPLHAVAATAVVASSQRYWPSSSSCCPWWASAWSWRGWWCCGVHRWFCTPVGTIRWAVAVRGCSRIVSSPTKDCNWKVCHSTCRNNLPCCRRPAEPPEPQPTRRRTKRCALSTWGKPPAQVGTTTLVYCCCICLHCIAAEHHHHHHHEFFCVGCFLIFSLSKTTKEHKMPLIYLLFYCCCWFDYDDDRLQRSSATWDFSKRIALPTIKRIDRPRPLPRAFCHWSRHIKFTTS
jgi:hypothetical protein